MCQIPFVVSPSAGLRTGLSNHEQPFDRLRVNGLGAIFVTIIGRRLVPKYQRAIFTITIPKTLILEVNRSFRVGRQSL